MYMQLLYSKLSSFTYQRWEKEREREMNWLTVQDFIVSWVTAQIYTIGWPVQVCYEAAMTLSKIIFKFTLSQTEQYLLKFSSKTNNMCVQVNFFLIFRINKIVDYRSSEMNIYTDWAFSNPGIFLASLCHLINIDMVVSRSKS